MYFCAQINAGTVSGTVIPNQANATGTQAGNTTTVPSNTATVTSGAAAGTKFAGLLATSTHTDVNPGQKLLIPHTLTNTGTAADNFSLVATDLNVGFTFAGLALYPDANNDGVPDSNVPVANPITLNPGQVFHFVMSATVPASATSF